MQLFTSFKHFTNRHGMAGDNDEKVGTNSEQCSEYDEQEYEEQREETAALTDGATTAQEADDHDKRTNEDQHEGRYVDVGH